MQTGRRTGLGIVGGRSFFGLTGEELALLERQQKEKGAVSGSVTQQAFQQTQQTALLQAQQAAGTLPRENLALGPFGPSNQLGIVTAGLRELSTTRLLKDVKNGLATPEEIAMLGLTPQDVQTLQAGKANVNALGQIAERIPIVGGRLRLGAGFSLSLSDLLGGPSKQVEKLLKDLEKLDGSLETDFQLAQLNPFLINDYISNVKEAEQNAFLLQSRIKLLFLQSPQLQGDPDNVDRIMAQIDDAFDKLELRKIKARIV